MNPNKRMTGENFTDYRERLAMLNSLWRHSRRHNRLLWNSRINGTYIRAKHGPLKG